MAAECCFCYTQRRWDHADSNGTLDILNHFLPFRSSQGVKLAFGDDAPDKELMVQPFCWRGCRDVAQGFTQNILHVQVDMWNTVKIRELCHHSVSE